MDDLALERRRGRGTPPLCPLPAPATAPDAYAGSLPALTTGELRRLRPHRVVLLGGERVLQPALVPQIGALLGS